MPTVKIEIEEHSGTQWHTEMDIGFPLNHHPKFNETSFEGTMAVMLVEYCKYRDDLTPDKLLEQIGYRVVELTRGKAAELEAKKAALLALPAEPTPGLQEQWPAYALPAGELIGPPAPAIAQEETGHPVASVEAPVRKRRGRPPRSKVAETE